MRTRTNVLAAFLALALVVPSAATAQYERTQDRNQTPQQQQEQQRRDQKVSRDFQPKLHKADALIGASVKSPQGEDLGEIRDLVMDSQHRSVSYAVLAFGGFLGLGQELHAIPWQAMAIHRGDFEPGEHGSRTDRTDRTGRADFDRDRDHDGEVTIVLNATKEQLENAQGFNNDQWPDDGDDRWTQNVHASFYGEAANQGRDPKLADRTAGADGRTGEEAMKSRRLSNILGETVKNHGGDDIGEIENILIDVNRGDLAYAVVDVSDLDDMGDTGQVAIPWRSLQTRGAELTVSMDKASLGRMNFDEDGLKRLENRVHAGELHSLSKSEPYWQGTGDASQRYGQGQQGERYGTQTDTATIITGKITRVMYEKQQGQDHLRFEVMTDDGRRIIVDAGQQQAKLKEGDQVTVTGTRHIMNDGQATFRAKTIRSGSDVLNVQRSGQEQDRDNR